MWYGSGNCSVTSFTCDAKCQSFRGPKLGLQLVPYMTKLHDPSLLAVHKMVMQEASVFASQTGIPRTHFKASSAWASNFTKRASLTTTLVRSSAQSSDCFNKFSLWNVLPYMVFPFVYSQCRGGQLTMCMWWVVKPS